MDATRIIFTAQSPDQGVYLNLTGAWYSAIRDLRVMVASDIVSTAAGLVYIRDAWNLELNRMIIDGNHKSVIGLYIDGETQTPVRKLRCRSLKITHCYGYSSIYARGEGTLNDFEDVSTLDGVDGIVIEGPQQYMNTFRSCEIENNSGYGVNFLNNTTKNKFLHCYFERNAEGHVYGSHWGDGNTFRDCILI